MNSPDSSLVSEAVAKSTSYENREVKPGKKIGWKQKVIRLASIGLSLLPTADKAMPPSSQPINSSQSHTQEVDLNNTPFAQNQKVLGQTVIDPRDVSSFAANPKAVAGVEAAGVGSKTNTEPVPVKSDTVTATQITEATIDAEKKAEQDRIQQDLIDLEDVLGIPGAAKEYTQDPEKEDYSSFSIIKGKNKGLIFVTKGVRCGMEYEESIEFMKKAAEIINELDDTLIDFLVEREVSAISSDLLVPEAGPGVFKLHPDYEGSYWKVKGKTTNKEKGIILAKKGMPTVSMGVRIIAAEGYGAMRLIHPDGKDPGVEKTIFYGNLVRKNDAKLRAMSEMIYGFSYAETIRDLALDEEFYGVSPKIAAQK